MIKHRAPPLTDEEAEAPTRKLSVPAGIRRQQSTVPAPTTANARKTEGEEAPNARAKSGTRPAVSEEERERYERREMRETVPAPAEEPHGASGEVAPVVSGAKR